MYFTSLLWNDNNHTPLFADFLQITFLSSLEAGGGLDYGTVALLLQSILPSNLAL